MVDITGTPYRGLSPHQFMPMSGVHKALHWTAITLRSIAASELGRSAVTLAAWQTDSDPVEEEA
ncbi:MAG: hypothetical protein Kow0060_24210 [Methylohalobius crimeensis]